MKTLGELDDFFLTSGPSPTALTNGLDLWDTTQNQYLGFGMVAQVPHLPLDQTLDWIKAEP